jgi:phenylacetate-CoA ligase
VLHNFAMPLIRYDIGDFAEAGPACACGRGLPVLRRIHGRVRNMLVTADGRRYWPFLGGYQAIREAPQLRQAQFAQIAPDLIEARLVASGPLTAEQEEGMRRRVLARLPPGMRMRIGYRDRIARGAGGKFEEFVCELPARP